MEKRVKISPEDNQEVYVLYSTYMSYLSILQFLMNNENINNQEIFDKKWNEAVEINIKLEEKKRSVERNYKPVGDWDKFEFDFENQQVVFIKNEEL